MDLLRAKLDEIVDKVKEAVNGEPQSQVEILLDQYLGLDNDVPLLSNKNCAAVGMPTSIMSEFASRTRNIVDYPYIMERIWEILIDYQHDPNLMKKALNLLHYLLVNGSIQVFKDCQVSPRMPFLESLMVDYNRYEFEQYKFSQHLDIGAGVRKVAAEIVQYLVDEQELLRARRNAEQLHRKLSDSGLRSPSSDVRRPSSFSNTLSDKSDRPPRYTDSFPAYDDIGSKIITHPDEMFQEPLVVAQHASPTARPLPYSDRTPEQQKQPLPPTPMRTPSTERRNENPTQVNLMECVDLLGLDTSSLGVPAPQTRTKSPSQPQKMVATI